MPVRKVAGVRAAIEKAGAQLWLLPPYSPDFNPIENAFAKLKAILQKAAALAISIGFGIIPLVAPSLFRAAPDMLRTVLDSDILLASVVAVALNIVFKPHQLTRREHDAPVSIADHA